MNILVTHHREHAQIINDSLRAKQVQVFSSRSYAGIELSYAGI